ncbi:glycoside hydrolase family 28 protein [Hymenobacter sp. H14-R3]|uniref:glycoside hydrolase family 28 protein n=1 Tax=Hymenobacter sp. H14-R3 TaxID=3046308 RepID=UPI0024B8E6B8|nr:glycoside hydrolase family 28 protein [Hymenobacter sp. H14-R3]MDJ0364086.1 glycoside hydrolase family 28 protein [Hymenobacter sp. H14-R3]
MCTTFRGWPLALAALLLGCRAALPTTVTNTAAASLAAPRPPQVFNVRAYGAVGDGRTDDAPALQRALDACAAAGGGRVLVPAGATFVAGPFALRSHVELCVESGATILASPDLSRYTQSAFAADNLGEGSRWISADNLEQVTLCGGGTIDGNSQAFLGPESGDALTVKRGPNGEDMRPHVLTLVGVKGLRIRDLAIGNAAYWNIHLAGCDDVAISDLTVRNDQRVPNSDGIDVDHSRRVRITNCHIESGDDAICLKNRREFADRGPCEDITVSNCTLISRSCAFKIGSENVDHIGRVVVDNCVVSGSNRGLGIQNRDEGTVSNVLFSNIIVESHYVSGTWWGKAEPIYVTAFRRPDHGASRRYAPGQTEGRAGAVHDIYFSNIKCQSENGIYVSGETAGLVSNIFFDQVDVQLTKTTALPGGVYDQRPAPGPGLVPGSTSAFYLDRASAITLRNCSVRWGANPPAYFAHALESHGVTGLRLGGLTGESAFPKRLAAAKEYPTPTK